MASHSKREEDIEGKLKSLRHDRNKLEEKKKNIEFQMDDLNNTHHLLERKQTVIKNEIRRLIHKRYMQKKRIKNTESKEDST